MHILELDQQGFLWIIWSPIWFCKVLKYSLSWETQMKSKGEKHLDIELLSSSWSPSYCSPACVECNRKMSSNEIVENTVVRPHSFFILEKSGTLKRKRSWMLSLHRTHPRNAISVSVARCFQWTLNKVTFNEQLNLKKITFKMNKAKQKYSSCITFWISGHQLGHIPRVWTNSCVKSSLSRPCLH